MDTRVVKQVTADTLIKLAELVLKKTFFEYSDKTYKQIPRTAIAIKFVLPYAILLMATLAKMILSKVEIKSNF